MITLHTTYLGMSVTALCFLDRELGWCIEDLKVTNEGHDMYPHLSPRTLKTLHDDVIEQVKYKVYSYS